MSDGGSGRHRRLLGTLKDTELADLLTRRTDLHRSPQATLKDLGARLSNPWGVEQVLGLIDRTAAQVGAYVSHLGGGSRTTRVIEAIELEGRLLNAWCRLRDDERNFDPDSITAVRPAR